MVIIINLIRSIILSIVIIMWAASVYYVANMIGEYAIQLFGENSSYTSLFTVTLAALYTFVVTCVVGFFYRLFK